MCGSGVERGRRVVRRIMNTRSSSEMRSCMLTQINRGCDHERDHGRGAGRR